MRKLIIALLLIVSCLPTMGYASSSITVTISDETYSYYDDGTKPEYNMHFVFTSSMGTPVYCGNHGLVTAVGDKIGDSKSLEIKEYNDETVRKILYYGYLGPKEWSGFSEEKYNAVYKAVSQENKRKWCGNAVTGIALTKTQSYGYVYDVSGLNEFWEYIKSAKAPPSGFKTYVMYGNSTQQDLFTWTYKPSGELSLKKEIASDISLVKDCPQQYSLECAEYLVSKDRDGKNVVGTLITRKDGTTNTLNLSPGAYYIKETKAPKGYKLDKSIYEINVKEDQINVLTVKDEPLFNQMELVLIKKDMETKEGLEGAIFKVNYYKEFLGNTSDKKPDKTWLFKTDSDGKICLDDCYKVGGDDLYKNDKGIPVGLIGTYEFIEVESPCGYVLDESPIIRYIVADETGETTVYNPPEINDIKQTISIILHKYNAAALKETEYGDLSGAKYEVRNALNEVVGTIITNEKGIGRIDGLLPGKYLLKEVKAPVGFKLNDNEIIVDAKIKDSSSLNFEYFVETEDEPLTKPTVEYKDKIEKPIPLTGDKNDIDFWYKILIVISIGAVLSNISMAKKY